MTFSHYYDHTNPLFINLRIIKLRDLVFLLSATFICDFHSNNLPDLFKLFFLDVQHSHNTRFVSHTSTSYRILEPDINLTCGFFGPKMWNSIDESFK